MKPVLLVAVIVGGLCLGGIGRVQEPRTYKSIDQHALQASAEVEASLDDLADYLVKPCKTDRDKARAIYRWITDRIAYDAASFFAKMPGDNSAVGVLTARKGVCAGYANLFAALGKRAGLEIATINGFAKGVAFDPAAQATEANHAWTAVRLNGEWRLIDSTWGAGYINGKEFVKRFADFYFLVAPDTLAFSHLPTDEKWQLLKTPLSPDEFLEQPKVDRGMWELGITGAMIRKTTAAKSFRELVKVYSFPGESTQLVNAPLSRHLKAGSKYTFEFNSGDFVELAGFQDRKPIPFMKKGNVFRGVLTPRAGDLKIVGRTKAETNRYAGILEYVVE